MSYKRHCSTCADDNVLHPSCDVINRLERCADLYDEGRDGQTIKAIVLHEVDLDADSLDAMMAKGGGVSNCKSCNTAMDLCHRSFHYVVTLDGNVRQYVDIANQSWTFPMNWEASECGICDWSLADSMPDVDPDTYTINIAIPSGTNVVRPFSHGGSGFGNVYSDKLVESLAKLICCLLMRDDVEIETIDANSIWRHCCELEDFPECSTCKTAQDYDDFLAYITTCQSIATGGIPDSALRWCDIIEDLPAASCADGPCDFNWVTAGKCEVENWVGQDNVTLNMTVSGLSFMRSFYNGRKCADVRIDVDNTTNIVTMTFDDEQNNLELSLCNFDLIDMISGFSVAPDAVTGDLLLNANVVTSGVDDGCGTIQFVGPLTELSFTYGATGAITDPQNIAMCAVQSDEIVCCIPEEATAGVTQLVGADCMIYTLPDPLNMTEEICEALALIPVGADAVCGDGILVLGQDCEYHLLTCPDFCTLLSLVESGFPDPVDVVPDVTELLGTDCLPYVIPPICEQFGLLVDDYVVDQPLWLFQNTGVDVCQVIEVPTICDQLDADYDENDLNWRTLGLNGNFEFGLRPTRSSWNYTSTAVDASAEPNSGIVLVDATSNDVTVTLDPPAACDPNHMHVKRIDTSVFTVTVASADLIDGVASIELLPSGPFAANGGESVHLFWNGTTWYIL